jgi:FkbM family methyltransferase
MRYDFIEIGTCDFASESRHGGVGISVEPIQEYLDNLPTRADVIKDCCAISDTAGEMEIYYVPPSVIEAQGFPKWMRGCNKVGAPHPTVQRWLARHGHSATLIERRVVPIRTFAQLCEQHDVTEIAFLKIDTEGHDYTVLQSLKGAVLAGILPWPARIKAECNALSSDQDGMLALLTDVGYTLHRTQNDVIAVRK